VRVRLDRVDEAARLRVDDNGAGIRAEFLPRVFEPFAREADFEDEGAGLGLTMAQDVVQLHGGSIEAKSPGPNLGSTFTVTLPALIVPPELYWG
jgi:signal transduction histidine kinase